MPTRFLNNIKINDSYELPEADGTENQIIVTDGAGDLYFGDISTISSVVTNVQSDTLYYEVKNSTGTTIETFKGVMAVGTDGNSGHILIDEMVADGTVEARYFLGITQAAIPNGGIGRVIAFGEIDQVNTNAFPDGTILWCDPANPGDFTATEPDGPNLKIPAAFVLNQATNGKIQVRVQGHEGIKDLYDTKITTQVDGDVLVWKGAEGVWQNDSTINVDYAAGYIGIGTTDPDTKLDVVGRAVIGTGNTLTNATNATVIGNSNNLTSDSIVDANTNLVLGDYGAGRYGNTVISDRTLRLGRADVITATELNTTGILNFNDSVEANSAFSNVGGIVGYFPPPTATNDYYFISAFSENVNGSAFATGASPTASRYQISTSSALNCIVQKFDGNTTNSGAVYIIASNNSSTPSSKGIFTFDARHQNQNSTVPNGHALFEVTSGYGQSKFIIKQVNGSSNVGIGTTSPATKLEINGPNHDENFTSGCLMIQQADGSRIFIDGNDIDAADGILFLNDYSLNAVRLGGDLQVPNGNVGIGTTSPGEKLEVSGNIKTTQTVTQGTTVTFTKPDNSTTYETIATNIAITRGYAGAIYNPLLEDEWGGRTLGTPSGLLFNIGDGWSDLSDIATRTYVTFGKLWNYNVGINIVNEELVMWDYLNNEYHKIKFTSWTAGGGGGFVYQRTPLTLTENKVSTDVLDVNHQLNLYGPVKAKNRIEFDVDVDWTEGEESISYYLNSKLLVDPVLNNVKIGRNVGFTASAGSINNYDNQDKESVMIGENIGIGSSATHRVRHQRNVFIGSNIASTTKTADGIISNNVAIGQQAGQDLTSASGNTLIGLLAGANITSGNYNVCLGQQAGDFTTTGSNNTSIGYQSDPSSSSVSNTITLGNSSVTALRCQVTSITSLSDKRDKTNIEPSTYGLNVINKLNPVTFDWNMRDEGKVGDKDLGFIAQDLQEVDDENLKLVYEDNPEKLEASYGRLIPVMTKAIQELSAKIESLESRIQTLENQ